ncbi:MAG: signal peptidase I [Acutalibacteraceae bacterium]|nr:signal peptidase I [Acutalibacteraceae bacterium]
MKKAKKIFSRIMTVISVALFIFGVVVFVSVLNASAGKVPSVFGFSVLQVKTGSMLPDYEIGTIVITKNVDANDLQVGDVISFYSLDKDISGEVNTHRIEKIEHGGDDNAPYFTTKGDNNTQVDKQKVWPSQIVGKVVYNLGTVSGSVIGIFQNPNVIFFVIVLPLIFITFGEAVNLVTMIAESKYRKKEDGDDIPEEKN